MLSATIWGGGVAKCKPKEGNLILRVGENQLLGGGGFWCETTVCSG